MKIFDYNDIGFEAHSVFKIFITYFGMSLCIIPELIIKFKTKNVNSENSDINKNIINHILLILSNLMNFQIVRLEIEF